MTTVRRDGTPVATPVWVVAAADRLYVWTGSETGKVKRIRNNPAVMLAPCTRRGNVTGPAVPAQAMIVPVGERPEIWRLFTAKYGMELRAIVAAERILGLLRGGPFRQQGEPDLRGDGRHNGLTETGSAELEGPPGAWVAAPSARRLRSGGCRDPQGRSDARVSEDGSPDATRVADDAVLDGHADQRGVSSG